MQEDGNYFQGDELSASVWLGKYALRNEKGEVLEKTPADTHRRMSEEFARIEAKYPNPLTEEEIYNLFASWTVVPQGSPMSAIGNPYQIQSLSNCFVVPNTIDSYGGILHTDQQLAQIMKRRGGVGVDISPIRPRGMKTSNAAGSTDGIGVFMDRYSSTCREVAQGGRRGALMITCSCLHPDIQTFISIKQDKTKVTGANVSVRMTDEFLRAVESDSEITLRWPVTSTVEDAKFTKVVRAKEIWDQLVEANWNSAEPGILFWDTVLDNSMADIFAESGFETISTNPCVVGDTQILTADGYIPIRELVEAGEPFLVSSVDPETGDIENNIAFNPRLTKSDTFVWRLEFSDGSYLIATPDHRVMRSDLTYAALKDFAVGDKVKQCWDSVELAVTGVEPWGTENVYNITVQNNHNYFVDSNGEGEGICVSNCGEITLSQYDSCRLMLLNLTKFVSSPFKNGKFDYASFAESAAVAQRLMDDLVDLEIEAVNRIITKVEADQEPANVKAVELDLWQQVRKSAEQGRRTGLGITGLGDALAMIGVKYGSRESVEVTEQIYKTLAIAAHEESVKMAKERGAFPACNPEYYDKASENHPFLSRLIESTSSRTTLDLFGYGRRNIALTTTAPAGSMSILTQTSSGCEPIFMLSYTRRKKINPNDTDAQVDFIDGMGDKWSNHVVHHHGLKQWMEVTGETDITKSPYWGATANEIDWEMSVELQAAAQRWVEHAISKTCNLPSTVTKEQVSALYLKAWKSGCKGFTIYRDGSRSGVLVSDKKEEKAAAIVETRAPKRPKSLKCDIHRTQIGGEQYAMIIGLLNGKPYEIFCGKAKSLGLPKRMTAGNVVKNAGTPATYDLTIPVGSEDDPLEIKDLVSVFDNPAYESFTRTLSLSLRHGVPVQFVVEQLRKDKHSDITSFSAATARILSKHYISDGTTPVSEKKCGECGSDKLSYEGGCILCRQCGFSKCA